MLHGDIRDPLAVAGDDRRPEPNECLQALLDHSIEGRSPIILVVDQDRTNRNGCGARCHFERAEVRPTDSIVPQHSDPTQPWEGSHEGTEDACQQARADRETIQ